MVINENYSFISIGSDSNPYAGTNRFRFDGFVLSSIVSQHQHPVEMAVL
ncbi:hypothetical protein Xhom_01310 [Xenorhabdus hominickii]|uniref:Uncharacterized protein n=1 Tax=Xenorhabdus hominickii TaxID=351679 RepID=A0A2G0QGD5_XENHO|nr:hypothetical protein Xhom_01310 [Xenorhabdus hominickii]